MTFAAMAAWQAWLLIGGALALAGALFLIKLKPPRVLVPSLLLWRKVLDESREVTLWERIRRAVSFALTLLVALALALALVRPGRITGSADAAAGRVLIVLDSSWSMQARTPSGETRWERAVAEARRLLASASGEVALATTADGLVEGPTADTSLVDAVLDRIAPGGGQGTAWPKLTGAASAHFITDGAVPRPLDAAVIVHSVFEPAGNVAVTAFQARPSLTAGNAADAYLEVANFARSAQRVRLRVSRGEAAIFDRELEVGAGEALRQVVPIARGGAQALSAHVDVARGGENALAADDDAAIWVEKAKPVAVTVVGSDVTWLRTALANDPGVRASFITPDRYSPEQVAGADAVIFDEWAPPQQPPRPSLLFAPPASTAWLTTADAAPAADERRPRWDVPGSHPVVLGVDPYTLSLDRARIYSSAKLTAIARSARGTPLVSVAATPTSRLAIVGFGAHDSNLPSAPGFPVLLGNAIDWLARPAVALSRPSNDAGTAVSRETLEPGLTMFEAGVVRVTDPEGGNVRLWHVGDQSVGMLRAPGLYVAEGGGARTTLAVNVGSPQLSNLLRAPALPPGRARAVASGASPRPWWLYCALAAFALCIVEWWTWQRRITV